MVLRTLQRFGIASAKSLAGKANSAPDPVDVIVRSRQMDEKLYIELLESGAYDFITPPFAAYELEHIARCAAWNVGNQSAPLARVA